MAKRAETDLNIDEAATLLDIKVRATLSNWLLGGHFPGSYLDDEGCPWFTSDGIEQVLTGIAALERRNEAGELTPPTLDPGLCLCMFCLNLAVEGSPLCGACQVKRPLDRCSCHILPECPFCVRIGIENRLVEGR